MTKWVIILIIAIFATFIATSAAFYFFYPKEQTADLTKIKMDLNTAKLILNNPNEYNNPVYLRNLTMMEKLEVISAMNRLLYDNCRDGKIEGNCTNYLIVSYLNMRQNIGIGFILPTESGEKTRITASYIDFKNKHPNLNENDLNGFAVPMLAGYCSMNIIDVPDKLYWSNKILSVNKTTIHSTEMQIHYFAKCMSVYSINDLNSISGYLYKNLSFTPLICNIVPERSSVNTKDLCSVYNYMNVKRFCALDLASDKDLVQSSLSVSVDTYNQKLCQEGLSAISKIAYGG
jgi:hypothetical protein